MSGLADPDGSLRVVQERLNAHGEALKIMGIIDQDSALTIDDLILDPADAASDPTPVFVVSTAIHGMLAVQDTGLRPTFVEGDSESFSFIDSNRGDSGAPEAAGAARPARPAATAPAAEPVEGDGPTEGDDVPF